MRIYLPIPLRRSFAVASLLAATAPVGAWAQTCETVDCCIDLSRKIVGTAADDVLRGNPNSTRPNCLVGLEGSDRLQGSKGLDLLLGGDGNDRCFGLGEQDTIVGGAGDDLADGGDGDDVAYGGRGRDNLIGGMGSDNLWGGNDADTLDGGEGDDALWGGRGDDEVDGGLGNDIVYPGGGIDTVRTGDGDDLIRILAACETGPGELIDGGPGNDRLESPFSRDELIAMGVELASLEIVYQTEGSRLGNGACYVAGDGQVVCECCDAGFEGDRCESCAPGFHPATVDGGAPSTGDYRDLQEAAEVESLSPVPDVALYAAAELTCLPDALCNPNSCGDNGVCDDSTGEVACSCDPGWAGGDCRVCAPFYETDGFGECILGSSCGEIRCSGRGSCLDDGPRLACRCDAGFFGDQCEMPDPPIRVEVSGIDSSIAYGGRRELVGEIVGDDLGEPGLTWRIAVGGGCLRGPGGGACGPSTTSVSGEKVTFQSQTVGDNVAYTTVSVTPDCCPDSPSDIVLGQTPPSGIPFTGIVTPQFHPLDRAVLDFMGHRCVGGAVVSVSRYGKLVYSRGFGYRQGPPSTSCNSVADPFLGGPLVQPHTPFRIGSVSKPIVGAVARRLAAARLVDMGIPDPTHTEVEGRLLLETDPGTGEPVWLPQDLWDALSGAVEVPQPVLASPPTACFDSEGVPQCQNGACYTGVFQIPFAAEKAGDGPEMPPGLKMEPYCVCDTGFGGARCELPLDSCGSLLTENPVADSRWHDVTLGNLLVHQAGLARSAPGYEDWVTPLLPTLRQLSSEGDFIAEEGRFASEPSQGGPIPLAAKTELDGRVGTGYFVPRSNLEEAMIVMAGRCLVGDPGTPTGYSNTSFSLLGKVTEHLFAHLEGLPSSENAFSGHTADLDSHLDTALDSFLAEELEIASGILSDHGIFFSRGAWASRDSEEPVWRGWSTSQSTYYPLAQDPKRLHCAWDGDDCSFADWNDNDRFNWDWETELVLPGYEATDVSPVAGGLSVEAPLFTRFLEKYWVGADDDPHPELGELRDNNYSLVRSHNGARSGSFTWAYQLGRGPGADPFQYRLPPVDGSGHISGDFKFLTELDLLTCNPPGGAQPIVDYIVSVNQRSDLFCVLEEAEDEPDYDCDVAYGEMLKSFVVHGLCQIDWTEVDVESIQGELGFP